MCLMRAICVLPFTSKLRRSVRHPASCRNGLSRARFEGINLYRINRLAIVEANPVLIPLIRASFVVFVGGSSLGDMNGWVPDSLGRDGEHRSSFRYMPVLAH